MVKTNISKHISFGEAPRLCEKDDSLIKALKAWKGAGRKKLGYHVFGRFSRVWVQRGVGVASCFFFFFFFFFRGEERP